METNTHWYTKDELIIYLDAFADWHELRAHFDQALISKRYEIAAATIDRWSELPVIEGKDSDGNDKNKKDPDDVENIAVAIMFEAKQANRGHVIKDGDGVSRLKMFVPQWQ